MSQSGVRRPSVPQPGRRSRQRNAAQHSGGSGRWRRSGALLAAVALVSAGGAVLAPAQAAPESVAASAVLGDPPEWDGMSGQPGDASTSVEAATRTHDGRSCWIADPELDNDFLYFAVDDSRVPAGANTAFVTLTYFDAGPGNFTIHYDGENDAFTRADAVELTGDGTWKTTELQLEDIRFDGRANDHDFRIASWDERFGASETPVCVGEIGVSFDYIPPDLEVLQHTPGNIFTQPDTPAVDIETQGDTVAWEVRDFWGERVLHGTEDVGSDGALTLELPVDTVGYYSLDLTATTDGELVAQTSTDLALLTPFDVAEVEDSRFGTVPHSTREDNFDKLALAAAMGAKNVREAALWISVEEEQGEYTYGRYDPMVDVLNEEGMRWMPVASYLSPFYDDGGTPYTDEGRQAYANYIADVADRYRDDVAWIEIYNEFNIKQFGARGGSPANAQADYYFPMLREAYQSIKETTPDMTVVGGVTSSVSLDWLEELFSLGGLEYMDVVSVHPYVFPSEPEAAAEMLADLKDLIREYNDGELIPIWITEQGYPTNDHAKGVSEAAQTAYLVRSHVIAFSEGVDRMFWYNLMNEGVNPVTPNHNYGLIRNAADERGRYAPKPGYVAYAAMTRQLTGLEHQSSETVGEATSHLFKDGREQVRVVWSADTPTTVQVRTGQPITVTDHMGHSQTYQPRTGRVHLSVGEEPIYITGRNVQLRPGEKFDLSADAGESVAVGDEVDLTLTVDNTVSPRAPIHGTFTVAGESVEVSVRPGEVAQIPISLPAEEETGQRTYVGELSAQQPGRSGPDEPRARLATTVQVTSAVDGSARHILDGEHDALTVDLQNTTQDPVHLDDLQWQAGDLSGEVDTPDVLDPGTHTLTVPLADLPEGSHEYQIEVAVEGHDDVRLTGQFDATDGQQLAGLDRRSIQVDGELDDLDGVTGVNMVPSADGQLGGRWTTASDDAWVWGGEDDLSGTIWPTWDEENLYLSARVSDDEHHQHHPPPIIWQGDSVAFTLSAGMPDEERPQHFYEYRMALTDEGPILYRDVSADEDVPPQQVFDAEVEIVRDEATNTTTYELAVPWETLAPMEPGDQLFSTSLRINDNDGLDRTGWLAWTLRPVTMTDS